MPSWVDRIAEAHNGYDTDYLIEALVGPRRDSNGRFIKGSGSSKRPSRPSFAPKASPGNQPGNPPEAAKKPTRRGFVRWLIDKAKSALKYVGNKVRGRQ